MIFLDTSAFLALENRKDEYHEPALMFRDSLLESICRINLLVISICYKFNLLRMSNFADLGLYSNDNNYLTNRPFNHLTNSEVSPVIYSTLPSYKFSASQE